MDLLHCAGWLINKSHWKLTVLTIAQLNTDAIASDLLTHILKHVDASKVGLCTPSLPFLPVCPTPTPFQHSFFPIMIILHTRKSGLVGNGEEEICIKTYVLGHMSVIWWMLPYCWHDASLPTRKGRGPAGISQHARVLCVKIQFDLSY